MATIPEAMAIAIRHHQGGRLEAAEQIYRQILRAEPNQPDAIHFLGLIAHQLGKHAIAVEYMGRAIQLKPDFAEALYNLGIVLKEQGKLDEAAACYRRALQWKPDFVMAHFNLGNALKGLGELDEAIDCYRRTLKHKPDFAEAYNNLGVLLRQRGNRDDAAECFRLAVRQKPDFADAYNNLGIVLKDQGKPDEACDCYRRAVQVQPNFAMAHYNLGNELRERRKLEAAVASYRRALQLRPDYAEAHNNLGAVLHDLGKLDEAASCYRQVLLLRPDYAEVHNNLGSTLREQGKLDEAAACVQRALQLNPDDADAHWNQWILSLRIGDFERGWAEYEWRLKTNPHGRRDFSQPRWDGQPLSGKTILLHAEQGLGDTLQFVRYAALVKQRGGRILLECQRALLPFLADCPGIDQVVAQGDLLPAFEVEAPLLSLPGILGTTLDSIPASIPYLQADPERIHAWRQKLKPLGGIKVGIVWQGNPEFKDDRQRSIPLRYYEVLARVEGVRLVSLQKGPGAEQLPMLTASFPVLDLGQQLETFSDTAAVLQNLDLLISSCTSVPHLAGALGVRVWLALSFAPDWRWLLDRADSPWYPNHRLFRQQQPGDWHSVFERMATELGMLA